MRYKSNESQLTSIVRILDDLITKYPAKTVGEEIIEELVNNVFIKLQKKANQLYANKNGWAFNLTTLEGKALWIYFQTTSMDTDKFPYEATQVQKLFTELDKEYARTKSKNHGDRTLAPGASKRRLDSPARQN